jgi:hypothetical protein
LDGIRLIRSVTIDELPAGDPGERLRVELVDHVGPLDAATKRPLGDARTLTCLYQTGEVRIERVNL